MFCVYVLESSKNKELYIGFTKNLKRRIAEHNRGDTVSTKRYIPWRCIYCEYCLNETDGRRREQYFKTNTGRKMLKKRIVEYLKRHQVS
jgi:putative endonuclease